MDGSGFVDVPGGRLYYEADGSGHPLLLIHGNLPPTEPKTTRVSRNRSTRPPAGDWGRFARRPW